MDDNQKACVLVINTLLIMSLSLLFACLGFLAKKSGSPHIYRHAVTAILLAVYAFMAYQGVRMAPRETRRLVGPFVIVGLLTTVIVVSWELWILQ